MTIDVAARDSTDGALVRAGPRTGQAPDVDAGAADAAALVSRLGGALADIARTVDVLAAGLAPTLAAAAERDPALLTQAQMLDTVSQSLHGLTAFLADVGTRRVGCEPLRLEVLASSLPVAALADRMAGAAARVSDQEPTFF